MAKKAGRVSINALESTIDKEALEVDVNFRGVNVHIVRSISLQEMLEFVTSVTESCFAEDGTYMPEAFELAFICNVLTRYANFTLPESTEKKYQLIYRTDVFPFVCGHINMNQLDDIRLAINDKLKHKKALELNEQRAKMDELISQCSELLAKIGSIFPEMSPEEMMAALQTMGNQQFDEEKLVKAYMKEKQNSSGDE